MDFDARMGSSLTSVMLVEDHEVTRKGLRDILNDEDTIDVIGESDNAQDAVAKINQLEPDVVILDMRLRQGNGVDVTRAIKSVGTRTKVLILSAYDDDAYISSMARLGTNGYLLKSVSAAELISVVHIVAENGLIFDPDITHKVRGLLMRSYQSWHDRHETNGLSRREAEVLRQLGRGLRNREIAEVMGISVRTVEAHIANLLRKLGARNRTQATMIAHKLGLLEDIPP